VNGGSAVWSAFHAGIGPPVGVFQITAWLIEVECRVMVLLNILFDLKSVSVLLHLFRKGQEFT